MAFLSTKNLLKLLIAAASVSVPLSAGEGAPQEGLIAGTHRLGEWVTFTSEVDGFSVEMPHEPMVSFRDTVEDDEGESIEYAVFMAMGHTPVEVYEISTCHYVSGKDFPKDLSLLLDGFLDDIGVEIVMKKEQEAKGLTFLEFVIKKEGAYGHGKLFVLNKKLYSLVVSSPNYNQPDPNYTRFVESFKLINS